MILILIWEPVGRLSGGIDPGVGAQRPSGAARHSGRRCSEANRSRCARIDPGAKEPRASASGPNVRAKTFWLLWAGPAFRRLPKVTRRKGGTVISDTKKNGYSPQPPKAWSAQRPPIQCAVTRCRPAELPGESAKANCVRLCICVNRNTCDTYNFTVFSVIPNSQAI